MQKNIKQISILFCLSFLIRSAVVTAMEHEKPSTSLDVRSEVNKSNVADLKIRVSKVRPNSLNHDYKIVKKIIKELDADMLLEDLLLKGLDPNMQKKFCYISRCLLLEAIDSRNYGAMKVLLNAGADPNIDPGGWATSPLQQAVENEDINAVCILLHWGADPHKNDYLISWIFTMHDEQFINQIMAVLVTYNLDCSAIVHNEHGNPSVIALARKEGYEKLAHLMETYKPDKKTLVGQCINAIVRHQDYFTDNSFNILPQELKERLEPGLLPKNK